MATLFSLVWMLIQLFLFFAIPAITAMFISNLFGHNAISMLLAIAAWIAATYFMLQITNPFGI